MAITTRVVGPRLTACAFRGLIEELEEVNGAPEEGEVVLVVGDEWAPYFDAFRRARANPVRAVLLTTLERGELREASQKGIDGFVSLEDDLSVLIHALRSAARGEPFCSPGLQRALLAGGRTGVEAERQKELLARLSLRERTTADLVADGLSNREIAHRLCVSDETVKSTLKSIYAKLRIRRRTELVRLLARERPS
jgi:DNA-binding NarL/FixJ family response regulator